jgi:hypothetical protein
LAEQASTPAVATQAGGESQESDRRTAFHGGRDIEIDPRKFFEIVDVCAEKIMSEFEQHYKLDMERHDSGLKKRVQIAADTLETFVSQSIVMKNGHVHCQIHDKLFQNEVFFRKHLLNFHGAAIRSTQRKALLDLYLEMFRNDDDKPLPRLPKFVDDILKGEFTPPPDRNFEQRISANSGDRGGYHGRSRRDEADFSGPSDDKPFEPQVRRYRDPDAPKPEAVVEKPKKLQYRTRVSYAGQL